MSEYKLLEEIGKERKTRLETDPVYMKHTALLLEALAVESSGRYGGGFSSMESALQSAEEHNKGDYTFTPELSME